MFRYALTALLFAAPLAAQSNDDRALGPILPPKASRLDYAAGSAKAVRDGLPLVTFLGAPSRSVPGTIACASAALTGYSAPAVVIALPDGSGWLTWQVTLPADATDAQIAEAVKPRAAPFSIKGQLVGPDGKNMLPVGSVEAMDELNEQRARQGLFPFIRDVRLTLAAARAAHHRAARGLEGHTENDFAFLDGSYADSAGCGAWPVGLVTTDGCTFGTCCMDSTEYRHAGAAWVMGGDGRRYMHLFVRR